VDPAWIGPAIGLTSLALGIVFFANGRRARMKGPTWHARSNNLIQNFSSKVPGLEILFRNDKIDTLTVTRLAFWNRGMATIDRNDIAPADPVKIISTGDARLLNVEIIQTNNSASQVETSLDPDGKSALIAFDFLDHNQGVVVQIIHTGVSGDALTVQGTIKGAGTPLRMAIKGHLLPLPTSPNFDRKLTAKTRRYIILLCQTTTALCVLFAATGILAWWLSPNSLAPVADAWAAFKDEYRWGALLALSILSFFIGNVVGFVSGSFRAATLPYDLMSLVDDPLEKSG
jgi:hypothetical protein